MLKKILNMKSASPTIPKQLLLTTLPPKSGNVGDGLITQSFLDVARHAGVMGEAEYWFREHPLTDELVAEYGIRPMFLAGMSVSNDLYPKFYPLVSSLDRMPRGLIPFGCSWQHPIGSLEHFEQAEVSGPSRDLLEFIVGRTGPIAVRDNLAEGMLRRNGIPSITVGDCGWYHLPSHKKPMRQPKEVRRIAMTTPHHAPLGEQSLDILRLLRKMFPKAEIALSLHSKKKKDHTAPLIELAVSMGIRIIQAERDLTIFDRYEEFDLHVGYRLHGHIGFLRRRIPSILIVEDARPRGFAGSIPVGTFLGFRSHIASHILAQVPVDEARQHLHADPMTVHRVEEFLQQELDTGFLRYSGVATYLDNMLEKVFIPQLKKKHKMAWDAIRHA